MRLAVAFVLAAHFLGPVGSGCHSMNQPVDGVVVRPYSPVGRFDGHWGLDFGVDPGTEVVASDSGVVSFAGVVVGNRTVTIDHGGNLKSSYSYLSRIAVEVGDDVARGSLVGLSGVAHGSDALHFSIRLAGSYFDPAVLLTCSLRDPALGLRLVPTSRKPGRSAYPVRREERNPRRDFRPASHRTPHRR